MVGEVAQKYPLAPYKRALAREAWKRYLIAQYVRDARLEAYCEGRPDPFPVRPVPTSSLDSQQMSELIESCAAWCAQHSVEPSK